MLKEVKNIIFDLGGVLYAIDYSKTLKAFDALGIKDADQLYTKAGQSILFDDLEIGKISKTVFGKYFEDPSNKNEKYLRTKVRNLKKPLEKSGIKYEKIFKSIQNLSISKTTLEGYLNKTFKELIKKSKSGILINFKKYKDLNKDIKIAVINQSIKQFKSNYYDLRSKKVENLINNIDKNDFKNSTLGGCIFFKKGEHLCLKVEKP